MAVGDPYVTRPALKASVSILDDYADEDVDAALLAASRAIEQCAHRRTFWKDSGSTTREYTATTARYVKIDDAESISAVAVDGTALGSTDWFAEPANAPVDGLPFIRVRAPSGNLSPTIAGVAVTGVFGWPAVPPEVTQLTTILASKLLKRTREAPFGVLTSGGIDGTVIRIAREDPDARLLLKGLTRPLTY